jgi:Uma2 family endonuclease
MPPGLTHPTDDLATAKRKVDNVEEYEEGMSTALQLLSLEEFMALPEREDGQREELLEGELIVSPAPKVPRAEIVVRLRRYLASLEERGYVVSESLEFHGAVVQVEEIFP